MASFIRCIGLAGALLGIIEGIAWLCMSIVAVLIAHDAIDVKFKETHNGNLSKAIVGLLKKGDAVLKKDERLVLPDVLSYWLYYYIAISVIWAALSSVQLFVILKKKEDFYKRCLISWAVLTCLIMIVDTVLESLLLMDYELILEQVNERIKNGEDYKELLYLLLATAVTAIIAAKGFVLGIVNVVVAIFILVTCLRSEPESRGTPSTALIGPFGSIRRSPTGSVDCVNKAYARSGSFEATPNYETNLPRLAPVPATISPAERLAKLSKPKETYHPPAAPSFVYPDNVKIPRVDYSPPNSVSKYTEPKRNRTHYIYGEKY